MQIDKPPENALPEQAVIATSDTTVKPRQSSWSVLRHRNYALLFWGQLVSSTGTQMQIVAVAWQIFLLTHSAIALGLIGLFQAIPRIIFSLIGGIFADAFDRRKLLLVIQMVLATLSAVLALCTLFHVVNLFIIYAVVLVAASVSAFDFPTRQAILPNLVPRERLADAMPPYMAMIQLTGIVGATVGGFVIAWLGLANTYWIDVASYVVVIGSLLFMTVPRIPVEKRTQAGFRALADGGRFLRTQPVILAIISLDFFATFFGSPLSLLPIFASTILHVNAQ
jgi:MFS family permease